MKIKKPNWNAVALSDVMGSVSERYKYDGFGRRTVLSADAVVEKPSSEYNWNRAFTGQVLDSETGMILYRMRYLNVLLGRFVNRDPIGYEAGDNNLYRYCGNQIISRQDPDGCLNIKSYFIVGDIWREAELRSDGTSQHCYAACRLDLLILLPLGAILGDLREIKNGLQDDWMRDIYNNHKGSNCAIFVRLRHPILFFNVNNHPKLCDECCGTCEK